MVPTHSPTAFHEVKNAVAAVLFGIFNNKKPI